MEITFLIADIWHIKEFFILCGDARDSFAQFKRGAGVFNCFVANGFSRRQLIGFGLVKEEDQIGAAEKIAQQVESAVKHNADFQGRIHHLIQLQQHGNFPQVNSQFLIGPFDLLVFIFQETIET